MTFGNVPRVLREIVLRKGASGPSESSDGVTSFSTMYKFLTNASHGDFQRDKKISRFSEDESSQGVTDHYFTFPIIGDIFIQLCGCLEVSKNEISVGS